MQRTAATDVNYFQTRYILSRIAAIRAHLLAHICRVALALMAGSAMRG
jgi:hypothetical protein